MLAVPLHFLLRWAWTMLDFIRHWSSPFLQISLQGIQNYFSRFLNKCTFKSNVLQAGLCKILMTRFSASKMMNSTFLCVLHQNCFLGKPIIIIVFIWKLLYFIQIWRLLVSYSYVSLSWKCMRDSGVYQISLCFKMATATDSSTTRENLTKYYKIKDYHSRNK